MPKKKKQTDNKQPAKKISLVDTVMPDSVDFNPDKIILNNTFEKIYTLYDYPVTVSQEWLASLMKHRNCFITYHLKEADKDNMLSNIERAVNYEKVKLYGSEERHSDSYMESQRIIEHSNALVKNIRKSNTKVVNLTVTFGVFGETEEELACMTNNILSDLDEKEFSLRPMSLMQKEGFLQQLPYCYNAFSEISGLDIPMKTWSAGLGVFTTKPLSDDKGAYLGSDLSGEPVFWNVWKNPKRYPNSNLLISGTTGSGKTTTVKKLLLERFARGEAVRVFDTDKEFSEISKRFRGRTFYFTNADDDVSYINPMEFRDFPDEWAAMKTQEELAKYQEENKTEKAETPLYRHLAFMKKWFSILIPSISDDVLSVLEKYLRQCYKMKGITVSSDPRFLQPADYPTIADLLALLDSTIEQNNSGTSKIPESLLNIVLQLDKLMKRTFSNKNGELLMHSSSVNMDNDFIVFDVKDILSLPENYKNAMFFNIASFMAKSIIGNASKRQIVLLDEIQFFASRRNAPAFEMICDISERCRKYKTSMWFSIQDITDFLREGVSGPGIRLMTGPVSKFIMKQPSKDIENLKDLFHFSDTEASYISTAQRGQGLISLPNENHVFLTIDVEPKIKKYIEQLA